MMHMGAVLVRMNYASTAISVTPKGWNVSVRMLDFVILHRYWDALVVRSQLSLITVFLGDVSRTLEVDDCGGVCVDVIKISDR